MVPRNGQKIEQRSIGTIGGERIYLDPGAEHALLSHLKRAVVDLIWGESDDDQLDLGLGKIVCERSKAGEIVLTIFTTYPERSPFKQVRVEINPGEVDELARRLRQVVQQFP